LGSSSFDLGPKWEFNLGVGFGLNLSTDLRLGPRQTRPRDVEGAHSLTVLGVRRSEFSGVALTRAAPDVNR
jgi:hypothetical protein